MFKSFMIKLLNNDTLMIYFLFSHVITFNCIKKKILMTFIQKPIQSELDINPEIAFIVVGNKETISSLF